MLKMLLGRIIPVWVVVLFAGCTSAPKHVRWYEGPPQITNEIALLTVQRSFFYASAVVEAIDGTTLRPHFYSANRSREIELMPGTHALGVAYYEGSTHSIEDLSLSADFQAGHTYNLRAERI